MIQRTLEGNRLVAWTHLERFVQLALAAVPSDYLDNNRRDLFGGDMATAVARRDTPRLFEWLVGASQFQGIGDANAIAFAEKHGRVGWHDIASALDAGPTCPPLISYWHFQGCRHRKAAGTCAEPQHLASCSLPSHPARKGSLTQAAYALFLFVRDLCDGDLVGCIDRRLAEADPGIGVIDRADGGCPT